MTIKELEALVGLPRASIRFYEQEGFLSPRRLKNNYRDYSPEDARTLSKIKLLRQLHLDLDSIRRLEAGELTLAQALEDQLSALGEDRAALDRADEVCRSLLRAGTDYAALDPGPWLEELERRPAPSGPHLAEPRDTLNLPGPWRRFFARQLDSALYTLPWLAIRLFVLRSYESYDPLDLSLYPASLLLPYLLSEIVLLTAVPAILTAAVLEPAFLHLLGATPGKWIMGLEVRNRDGSFLTWEQAGARTMGVIFRGEGLYIPLIDLWRNWRSYRTCMDGQVLPWDEGLSYTQKPRGLAWRAPLLAAVFVLCLCAQSVMISVSYALPYPDGLSSPAQLAENYNALCVRRGAGAHRDALIQEDGRWVLDRDTAAWTYGDLTLWNLGEDPQASYTAQLIPDIQAEQGGQTVIRSISSDRLVPALDEELILALSCAARPWPRLTAERATARLAHELEDLAEPLMTQGAAEAELSCGIRVRAQLDAPGYIEIGQQTNDVQLLWLGPSGSPSPITVRVTLSLA